MVGPRVYSFYSCTSSSENLSRLGSGTATVPEIAELGFSERVSQLIQAAAAAAAASRTPLGLGGEAGRRCSRFDMTLGSVEGHESNKYSWISWWQLLTVSCFKKYYQIIIMNRVLCFEINDFFFCHYYFINPLVEGVRELLKPTGGSHHSGSGDYRWRIAQEVCHWKLFCMSE